MLSATPRATLTHLSCSPNFTRASYLHERTLTYELTVNYNIASRAALSNSVYASVLKIPMVHADSVSKSLHQKFFFSRERPLLARGKIIYFATVMDTNRDSAHHPQNEDNFPTFSLGLEFLNEGEKEKNNEKGDSTNNHF